MTDEAPKVDSRTHRLAENKLAILVSGAIVLSFLMVVVAMVLYRASGAAQVDLSRPGYSSVREQSISTGTGESFESSGPITEEVLDDFEARYKEKSEAILDVRTFDASAMSNETLRIAE